MSQQAYPLQWPEGWARAKFRVSANFSTTAYAATGNRKRQLSVFDGAQRVLAELKRMGVREGDVVISTNVRPTLTGLPSSTDGNPADPGAAVYWRKGQRDTVMAIDQYHRLADNLAAIAGTLDAMRAIDRYGGASILERAFTGFTALPAPGQTGAFHWRDVLGQDIKTVDQLENAYARRRSEEHPDKGGSAEGFHAVQVAYEQARKVIRA